MIIQVEMKKISGNQKTQEMPFCPGSPPSVTRWSR